MMQLKVTAAGDGLRFLAPDRSAFDVKVGETAVVLGGAYGQSLIDSGFAELADAPAQAPAPAPAATAVVADQPKSEADIIAELVEVDGIGAATAKKLVKAGIQSIPGLIHADPIELAKAVDVPESKVTGWQNAANQLLDDKEGEP
ncbi:MAG: hypothetical protein HC804_04570 [Anaerolineae bacterium]|nr:hypothetical protein [Anaerolineae bacterium]